MANRSICKLSQLLVVILSCGAAVFATKAAAQEASWSKISDTVFEHLGLSNGIPNPSVQATTEDSDGFLWVGTLSGLARWDGYHFRPYTVWREDGARLPDNFIQCLHTDVGGHLWAGLDAGGLARYDRALDRFIVIPLDPRYPDRVVNTITDDGNGGLWIGTENGVDHLAAGAAASEHLSPSMVYEGGFQSQRIMTSLRDLNGTVWVGTAAGLYRFDQGQGAAKFVPVPLTAGKTSVPGISALFQDSRGTLWIGTTNHGAFMLEKGETVPRTVQKNGESGSPIETEWVTAVTEVTPGQIWLGTFGHGIVAYDTQTGSMQRLRHDHTQPTSLQNDNVEDLYRDRSGQVWISSANSLDRYDPSRTMISTLFGDSGGRGSLSKPDIWSVAAFDPQHTWLGLGDEGIDIVEPAAGRIIDFPSAAGDSLDHLPHSLVRALAKSPDGGVLVGTFQGLFHVDGTVGVTRVTVSPEEPEMGIDTIMPLDGVVWIGSRNDGLWKLNGSLGGNGSRIGGTTLTDQRVLALAAAPQDHLWVGTRNGLNLLNTATGKVEQILPDLRDPQSLSAGMISSLLIDRQGRLWVSTEGGGINLLEERDTEGRPRFRHFGTAEGLPHNNVNKLLMDKSGKIWASTDNGLASIDPDSFAIRAFQQAEGVAIPTYWINSGDVTEEGDLLFGGVGGLTVVHPDQITNWTYVPPIVVTDLRIGGKTVPAGRFSGAAAEPMIIQPEANSLSVEFAALDFSAPERNRYAYKLDGFDADWVETDSAHRLAAYTNLKPGTYTLHLRGSNRDGVWAETTLDLPIKVLPAWYQTWWFRIAMVLAGLLLVAVLVRSRTAYYRQRQKVLEQQVEMRTAELKKQSEELKNTRDQLKALLDNSGQGFLSFGPDLVVESEYSLACETMLGVPPAGLTVENALFGQDRKKANLFRHAMETHRACKDYIRRGTLLSMLPREIRRAGLVLKTAYRPIGTDHLMVVLTDVTEEKRLAERLETQYRRQDMVVAAVVENRDFFTAVEGYRHCIETQLPRWLNREEMPEAMLGEMFRAVHTYRGTLNQFHFEHSPPELLAIEGYLSEFAAAKGRETVEMLRAVIDLRLLRRCLALDLAIVEDMLGSEFVQNGARIVIPAALAEGGADLAARLLAGGTVDLSDPAERDLLREMSRINHVSLDRVLNGFSRMVRQFADTLGKSVAPLTIEGGEDILVDPRTYRDFFQALGHVFRNALSHGIERPDDRIDAGKDEDGIILCTVSKDAGAVTLTIADDGAGIDVARLRARLAELALPADLPDEEIIQSVFRDAVSTREQADEISGRGVGLAAVWQAVEALGGKASVASTPGRGTVFTFTLPWDGGLSVTARPEVPCGTVPSIIGTKRP